MPCPRLAQNDAPKWSRSSADGPFWSHPANGDGSYYIADRQQYGRPACVIHSRDHFLVPGMRRDRQDWEPVRYYVKGPQDILAQLQGQFGQFVPDMARAAREDFETQARATVMSVLSRLELVTREEFDAQQAVLMKTREKVEALESRVAELEQKLQGK